MRKADNLPDFLDPSGPARPVMGELYSRQKTASRAEVGSKLGSTIALPYSLLPLLDRDFISRNKTQ